MSSLAELKTFVKNNKNTYKIRKTDVKIARFCGKISVFEEVFYLKRKLTLE